MESFDEVTERASRVLIVASGRSAAEMGLDVLKRAREAGVYVLAVNRTWEWLKDIDGWFTLDPDKLVMRYLFMKDTPVKRYVAVPDDYGEKRARIRYHQNMPKFKGITYLRRMTGNGPFSACDGLSSDPRIIHTGNSAYGALGLARHLCPERIAMIGVDAHRAWGYAYIDGAPKTRLDHLPALFASAIPDLSAAGIQVVNGSRRSLVDCFPKMTANESIEWLMKGW